MAFFEFVQCELCQQPERARFVFHVLSRDELMAMCSEHREIILRSTEQRDMRDLNISNDEEFADLKRRRHLSRPSEDQIVASFQRERERRQRLGLTPPKMSMLVALAMQRRVERT